MTREEAVAMVTTEWWKDKSDKEIVDFQLYEEHLCMPFDRFHQAVEAALGRGVWTHEFAYPDSLQREYEGKTPRASFQDVLDKIPSDIPVVVVA